MKNLMGVMAMALLVAGCGSSSSSTSTASSTTGTNVTTTSSTHGSTTTGGSTSSTTTTTTSSSSSTTTAANSTSSSGAGSTTANASTGGTNSSSTSTSASAAGSTSVTTSGSTGQSSSTSAAGSTSASTGGSGSTGDIDPGCGTVTVQGSCQAGHAIYCAKNDLPDGGTGNVDEDCSQLVQGDTNTSCDTIDADYGVECVVNTGSTCGFQDQSGNPVFALCQGGPGAACAVGANGINCVTGAPTCTPDDDQGDFAARCLGNYLALVCQIDQLTGYDCASFGGTCDNASTGCIGVTAGGPCDFPDAGEKIFTCAASLTCTATTDGGGNICH